MFDLKAIRENPEKFDQGWARRGLGPQTAEILTLDKNRREAQTTFQTLQEERNAASKEIGKLKGAGKEAEAKDAMDKVSALKDKIQTAKTQEREISEKLDYLLSCLPNIPADDVPDGEDDTQNVEVRKHLEPQRLNDVKDHQALGENLDMIDFESAARMSGARFVVLKSGVARLERALAQFMLDLHTQEHGYTEVSVPLMVRSDAMYASGQLPKFADEAFQTTRGDWLISTSEISLANLYADQILDASDLPIRVAAFTPCFRSEAGAAGKDTRGMLRQHQFYKVELFSFTEQDKSWEELERKTACAEEVLKRLEIPFRTVALCTGDLGFCSHKTYDIEVWLPGENQYRENSSCSNCGEFQAQRLNTRYKTPDGGRAFVHTLNGSGVAVGRCLIAVLENYQQPDGSVAIPDVLKPYMGGIETLEAA